MPSIAKNFAYNILLNLSRVVLPLITAPYVSRILEPDGIGINGFANTYVTYFVLVALLGIPTYGIREVAKVSDSKEKMSEFVSQMMTIAIVCTLVVTVIFIVSVFLIPQLAENYAIILVAGTALYFAPFQIDWFFQGVEKFDFITKRTLAIRIVSIICIFLFIKEKSDLLLYVAIGALGGVVGNIWSYFALRKYGVKVKFSLRNARKHLKPLMILFSSSVAISVYVLLDTVMLGFISNYSQVGYYTNATFITRTLLMFITSLAAVVIPRLSQYARDKNIAEIETIVRKSFSIISFLAIPMVVGIFCSAADFSTLFFGKEFLGVAWPLAITSLLLIAIGYNNITGVQILIGMGFDKLFLKAVLIGAGLNVVLNLILIPFYGAIGASIASVSAETLILFITYLFVRRCTDVHITRILPDILKSLVGCIVFLPLYYLTSLYLTGWGALCAFILLGALSYFAIEMLMKHSFMGLTKPIINKILHR